MAYGARLESVLGATPREFESRILRPETGTGRAHCGHPDCRSQIRSPRGCGSESLSRAAVVDVDDEYGGVRVKSSRRAVCRVDLKVDPSCTGDLVVPGRDGAFGCALEFADAAVRRLLVGSCSEVVPQLLGTGRADAGDKFVPSKRAAADARVGLVLVLVVLGAANQAIYPLHPRA